MPLWKPPTRRASASRGDRGGRRAAGSRVGWNTFDLYSKHPATIESSNAIARIGVLLERFGPVSYDYRLFI